MKNNQTYWQTITIITNITYPIYSSGLFDVRLFMPWYYRPRYQRCDAKWRRKYSWRPWNAWSRHMLWTLCSWSKNNYFRRACGNRSANLCCGLIRFRSIHCNNIKINNQTHKLLLPRLDSWRVYFFNVGIFLIRYLLFVQSYSKIKTIDLKINPIINISNRQF